MQGLLLFCFVMVLVTRVSQGQDVDTKKYSYMCLEYNQDLCLGISPGTGEPHFDPNAIFYLQVKSRSGGEASLTDYKKTRWDISFGNGKMALSRFKDLCAVKEGGGDRAALYPCNTTFPHNYTPNKNYGKWKLGGFTTDPNGAGKLELAGGASQCLTVMTCDSALGEDYCNKDSDTVAWDPLTNQPKDLRRGAYVRLVPCFDSTTGVPQYKSVQIWRQQLDCAVGCTPGLQNDNQCQQVCNVAKCNFDNDSCRITPVPTHRGTSAPTTRVPTDQPTSKAPTNQPTTKAPTSKAPTDQPTQSPSTPRPTTASPTKNKVTNSPTPLPSATPTASPTVKCPTNGTLEYCGRFLEKGCTSPIPAQKCTWCLNSCLPKSDDPRVCQVPGLYDHCQAQCPTAAQVNRCRPAMSLKACLKRKSNCMFCSNLPGPNRCFPGKDRRVCNRPNLYNHCPTPAPTPFHCPTLATVHKCLASTTFAGCPKGPCVWCGLNATSPICRPRSPMGLGICSIPGNPVPTVYSHCPLLVGHPTASPTTSGPTQSPIVHTKTPTTTANPTTKKPTVQPTTHAPVTPTTGMPSTKAPTKRPTTARPTRSPTNLPTRRPSKAPTAKPTRSPTKIPTRLPTNSPTFPTKAPTPRSG